MFFSQTYFGVLVRKLQLKIYKGSFIYLSSSCFYTKLMHLLIL